MTERLKIAAVAAVCSLVLGGCVSGNQYRGSNDSLYQQDDAKPNERGGRSNEGVGTGR